MVEGSGRSSVRYLTQLARAASLARADSSYTLSGARSSDSSGGSGSLPLLLHQRSIFGTRGSYAPRAKVRGIFGYLMSIGKAEGM